MLRTLVVLGLCMAAPGYGQTITASLEGVVKDTTGAVINGARARITHTGTNVVVEVLTGEEGRFLAPALPAGPYSLTVEAPGFKKAQRSGITLQVNQAARIELVLEVGEVTDTIEVTAQAPLLESTSSSVGHVVDNARIVNLPLNQRNPFALAYLVPGVTGNIGLFASGQGNVVAVNGGRGGSTEFLLDGIPAAPPLVNPAQGFAALPSVDAVQEFKVQTNNYSAEFGRSGSGIINLIYKSGTNELHGACLSSYAIRCSTPTAGSVAGKASIG
ncbi:MAG: carboxypeptidase-like regulatory domain-containing protein [Acidobacteria bacterium]|nr:carboxypeptidase-like regulatory domain-containing protein [Acidobacteriota bacterium]